jgi:indole-3-glycerol phosphate synthase
MQTDGPLTLITNLLSDMNVLNEIVEHKISEVARRKSLVPIEALERKVFFDATPLSLRSYLSRADSSGIIAEMKRRSPSKGELRPHLNVERISIGYMQHGASALSVLTDTRYFGGSHADLEVAREFNLCPILCKDFLVDEYQIYEAKASGADVILLIAAVLSESEMRNFISVAHELKLEVLMEVHSVDELRKVEALDWDHIGVNARDLRDFSVSLDRAIDLAGLLPGASSKIAESGISGPHDLKRLKEAGFRGFLIGELFMKANDPGKACGRLIADTRELQMSCL